MRYTGVYMRAKTLPVFASSFFALALIVGTYVAVPISPVVADDSACLENGKPAREGKACGQKNVNGGIVQLVCRSGKCEEASSASNMGGKQEELTDPKEVQQAAQQQASGGGASGAEDMLPPVEVVHADTKLLPRLQGETKELPRERLYVAIDDHSRFLVADVLPDKSQESSAVFGEIALERMPFDINDWYTDRGTEWKGTTDHAFVAFCREHGMTQHFTKPRTPQTNGTAERVIRTLMEEWYWKHRFASREERRLLLYAYVDRFNHARVHGTLGMTPIEKLGRYAAGLDGDNAG